MGTLIGHILAYESAGEALEVANNAKEEMVVLSCFILDKSGLPGTAVCYIAVPTKRPLMIVNKEE